MSSKKDDGMALAVLKIAGASAISFFVWKLLQFSVGHRIDRKIEERAASRRG